MNINGSLPRSDEQLVLAVVESERTAMTRGDTDQYFAILTEDAVFLPPNTTAKKGEELRAWPRDFLDRFEVTWLSWVDGDTVVMGDIAYHDYAYSMKSTPRTAGEPVLGSGKGIEIYRREKGGDWKIVRNIWNSVPPQHDH